MSNPTPEAVRAAELLPCPFCGSAGMLARNRVHIGMACKVQCSDEDCAVERGCWYPDDARGRAKAASVWNTRKEAP